jgi:hypothetical protein
MRVVVSRIVNDVAAFTRDAVGTCSRVCSISKRARESNKAHMVVVGALFEFKRSAVATPIAYEHLRCH